MKIKLKRNNFYTVLQIVKMHTFIVKWSDEDGEFVATCKEFPSLSYLDVNMHKALDGIVEVVCDVVNDVNKDSFCVQIEESKE